jgi:D-glycero-alpha-D-manno-heptose 1-phosphate guanylyltransferase
MQAIVLAGGFGTRLRGVVPDLPKPLAPVAGRPFLAILLGQLRAQGFTSVVLSVGYRHEMIRDAFGERSDGMALAYAVEDRPLGTGGAIRLAARACSEADVFVLNGDSYTELDFAAMQARHRDADASLTVCTVEVADAARYGRVLVEDARLAGFSEKGAAGPGLINAGVYLMRRELLETLALPEVFSFENDVLAARLGELRPLVYPTRGRFIDIGVPGDYARAQDMFATSGS